MSNDVISFVERYQLIYEKDPNSKVFAPLAEAYRRMGLLDEAIDLAENGVKRHPHFSSGHVALGKCYVQKAEYEKAVTQLKIAVDLSPENILAHQLLAESYMKLKKPVAALQSYKMVLFLNPSDKKAAETVKKLETDVYAADAKATVVDEDFAMERLREVAKKADEVGLNDFKFVTEEKRGGTNLSFERELALLDSRFDRGDWPKARQHLEELLLQFPKSKELAERKAHMDELTQNTNVLGEWISPLEKDDNSEKLEKLKKLLSTVESRRKS